MKKFVLFTMMILFVFCSCKEQNKYKDNLNIMEQRAKQHIKDDAYKNLTKTTFLDFKSLKYDTITENKKDSMKLIPLYGMLKYYLRIAELQSNSISPQNTDYNYETLDDKAKEIIKKYHTTNSRNLFIDSAIDYEKRITVIKLKIKKRKNPDLLFRYSAYAKIQSVDNNGKNNIVKDTLRYIFDKNLNMILK